METGQSYNLSHKIDKFSLEYLKNLLKDIPNIKIIHENLSCEEYSFEIVLQKTGSEISNIKDTMIKEVEDKLYQKDMTISQQSLEIARLKARENNLSCRTIKRFLNFYNNKLYPWIKRTAKLFHTISNKLKSNVILEHEWKNYPLCNLNSTLEKTAEKEISIYPVMSSSEESLKINEKKLQKLKEQNKLLLEQDINENRYILRAYPPFVGLGTDTRCNLRCIMCIQRLHDKESLNRPTIEEKYLIKFAEQVFPTAEILQLNTAGEPLMSRHFDLELELSERYQVKLDVITNGTLLNTKKGRLEKICRIAKSISFSFDSPIKKTYEPIRIGAEFDQVVENMRLFHKYRTQLTLNELPSFCIVMVLMKRNLDELLHMVRFAKDIGADHLSVSHMFVHTKDMEDESLDSCKQKVNHLLSEAKELAKNLKLSISIPPLYDINPETESRGRNVNNFQNQNSEKPLKHCFFLWERVYIDSRANILVCCEPSHPTAGSLKDKDFQEIWNGNIYQAMRRTFTGRFPYKLCYECATSGYLTTMML